MRAALLAPTLAALLALTACGAPEPPRVVFDTDLSGDVDDVLALALLHTLADRGHCRLLAVTLSVAHPLGGPFADAIDTFYGRPDLPVGVTRAPHRGASRYLALARARDGAGLLYPHDLRSAEAAPDAVALLRDTLAAAPDSSVVLVQVGPARNLAGLLASAPDALSPLAGRELVRRKVALLSLMAGAFAPIAGTAAVVEANVKNDVAAMRALAAGWPEDVPTVWSGFEIGLAVRYPSASIREDFGYVPHHPVRDAYLRFRGPGHDRPTWDLTSVLYAVFPGRDYFGLSAPGRVSVDADGRTRFVPAEGGRDRHLTLTPAQAARVREAFRSWVPRRPTRP